MLIPHPGHSSVLNVLALGESWAAGGHMFPDLPDELATRTKRTVHVCAVSFSGKNSGKVYRGAKLAVAKTIPMLFHGDPDVVIVLNGVNDQVQHVGARSYADNTAKIVGLFPSTVRTVVVSAPFVHFDEGKLNPALRLKAEVQRYLFDGGVRDPNSEYRAALHSAHPGIQVIPYEDFMQQYDALRYLPDGIHLTTTNFHAYGRFLADKTEPASLAADPMLAPPR